MEPDKFMDKRGRFIKTYNSDAFLKFGIDAKFRETFYNESHIDVVRGMHFQLPPDDHCKLVYCIVGEVTDVLIDLRTGVGYGEVFSINLSAKNSLMIYIPKGVAHGFASRADGSIVAYKTTLEHRPENDSGVRFNSFDFNWNISNPLISKRDSCLQGFQDFITPW